MNANSGILHNGTSFSYGEVGLGFSLDGLDDSITVPASPSLDVGAGNGLTVECWINPSEVSAQHVICEWNDGNGNIGVHLWFSIGAYGGAKSIFANIRDTSGGDHYFFSDPGLVNANEFQHIAVTYDKLTGDSKIFYNGVPVASQNLGIFTPRTSYDFHLGTRPSGNGSGTYFQGVIDEVSIYNRALSNSEVAAIAAAGVAGKCKAPSAPFFSLQPSNRTVTAGDDASFSVVAGGTRPLFYQWRFSGSNIDYAVNESLVLTNVKVTDSGLYSVLVSNTLGAVLSSNAMLTVNPPPPCVPLPSGLVSWWRAENNAWDQVGGNDGTLASNVFFGRGKAADGFVFDGYASAVVLGNPANLQLQDLTIEAWIKRASDSMISYGSSGSGFLFGYTTGGYVLFLQSGNSRIYFGKAGTGASSSAGSITDTNFHHIAVTKSGSTVTFYIDGVLDSVAALSGAFSFSTAAAIGGQGDNLGSSFLGTIDELAVYNRALTAGEVESIYNAGGIGKCVEPTPPFVFSQPTNQTIFAGTTATLSVAAGGTPLLKYQWNFRGSDLPGQTNASLVLADVNTNQAGIYNVTITNLYGSITSSNALLSILFLVTNLFDDFEPGIDFSQWGSFGGTVLATNFGGYVSTSNSLWFGGEGSRFAATLPVDTLNGGTIRYYLRLASAISTVWDRVELPGDGVVLEYSTNAGTSWVSFATNNTPLYFNWTLVSVPIPAAAQSLATRFRWRQLANDGTNSDNWALDNVLITTIASPPEILEQPDGQNLSAGSTATFDAAVAGSPPLSYQWLFNGAEIEGATNLSLVLSNVQPSQAGIYSLKIANVVGTTVSSNTVLKVAVLFAFGNGQPLAGPGESFAGPVSVELTNVYSGGLIFYTLDASKPTFASSQYTAPFEVAQSAVLRAIGYRADFLEFGELNPISISITPPIPLTVSSRGGGIVTLNPPGGEYPQNANVVITAVPDSGWTFLQWLGDASGVSTVTNVTLTRAKSVQAVFGTTLSTTAAPVGTGGVTMNPPGGVYPYGASVQLSAIPATGNSFALWGNAVSGNMNPLSFVITNANPTVSSLFTSVPAGQAALTVVPVGHGHVSVNPRANTYSIGSEVSVTATADSGQSFVGWSGDAAGTQNPLSLSMNASKTIYAQFTKRPKLTIVNGVSPQEGVQLSIIGDPGEQYRLLTSSNFLIWEQLGIITNLFGTAEFTDTASTNSRIRFYRTFSP